MTKFPPLKVDLVADNRLYEAAMAKTINTNNKFGNSAKRNVVDPNKQVSTSFRNAATSVAVLDGPLGGVAGRMSSFASLASSGSLALGVFGVGVAAVTAGLYKSAQAYIDLEQRQLRTEAILKATGFSAGFTADQLDRMARSTALSTLASTQQIREAQDVLLTFRSISGPIFQETVALSQDLAVVMGTDAKQAALQLAKALEEPTIGLTALRRSGVSFTPVQKETIKNLAETNRLAEAQAMILAQVRKQVGGTGEAESGGLAGSVDTARQRYTEFLEALGKTSTVAETSQWWIDQLAGSLDGMRKLIDPTDGERVLALTREQSQLQKEMNELQERGFKRYGYHATKYNNLKTRNDEINAELELIRKARTQRFEEQRQAQDAADKAEAERIRESNDQKAKELAEKQRKELAARQKQSRAVLITLETQLADQEGRIQLSYERQVEQIKQLNLSKAEIEAQGYTSLEVLQTDYLLKAEANRDAALAKLAEKQSQRDEKETQRSIRNLEKQKSAWQRHQEALVDEMGNLEQASIGWTNTFTDAFTNMVTKGKLDFSSLAQSIVADLIKIQVQSNITAPLSQMLSGFFSSGGSSPTMAMNTTGGNYLMSTVAHTGGIVGSDALARRNVSPGVFNNAPKYHTGGIAGNEVPAILQKGEGVFTREQMRNLAPAGAGGVEVKIINQGQPMQVERQEQSMLGNMKQLTLFVKQQARAAFNEDVSRGQGSAQLIESTYGLSRKI